MVMGYLPNSLIRRKLKCYETKSLYENDLAQKALIEHGRDEFINSKYHLDQITVLHYAEHIAPIEGKNVVRFKVPFLKNGSRVWIDLEEYDTGYGIKKWPDRFFENILIKYFQAHKITANKVGNADSYLINVKLLVDFAVPIFVEESKVYIQ